MMAGYTLDLHARTSAAPRPQSPISKFRLDKQGEAYTGTLHATVGGRERKIADDVIEAWIIEGGRKLIFSRRDGAGGFEDEGESLRAYDARTGKIKKIMSEYVAVDTVTEVKTSRGRTALLVRMTDGGLGAYYLAVVDPARGEVFFMKWARLLSRRGDVIRVGYYREDIDWTAFYQNENAPVRPYRIRSYNLSALLRRPVIYNKRDRDF
ncbi:MAG TPA: hypothetical protein VN256_14760 [Pyrinomonadaceae bacterium]|nr:hypothetical protein [Pyrinomonadaceae bacterium]